MLGYRSLRLIVLSLVAVAALVSTRDAVAQRAVAATTKITAGAAIVAHPQANYVMQQGPERDIPMRLTISQSAYNAAKQTAAQSYAPGSVKPIVETRAALYAPVLKTFNFNGHNSTEGLRPPDTHGAVGRNHFVEVTNSHVDIWDKVSTSTPSTPTLLKSVTLASFFGYTAQTLFDPRVVYDSTWNRWIITAEAFPESTTVQRFFVAVSQKGDPTSTFWIYNLNIDIFGNNNFWDFPQLGIDQDSVLFTANIFASPSPGSAYNGADFFAVAKALLYNGLGFSAPIFTGLAGTLAPPIVLDQNASTFLIAAPSSGTTFTKYTVTNSSHPGSTAVTPTTITVSSYSVPPSAPQPGTTDLLDTSDSRFVNASTQNGDDLWQTHTVNLLGYAAPKFYRLSTGSNTVTQSGFYFASSSSFDFNASITANASGDCFVTYTSIDPNNGVNAQVRASGKANGETSISAGVTGITSPTFYNASTDTTERWGDYSAITIDPSNTATAWLVNEKATTNTLLWGSRIMKVGF